ncbi:MAG: BatA domain-containing protein [Pirellulaceae bacterium]
MRLPASLLGFWEFGSATMLVWGVAAAIPIVIHLLSRRARQTTAWAAMQFLQAALRKNSRRLQLEQLLLLALRAAVLLLLAIALAEPRLSLPSVGAASGARGRTHTILVLDGSYSMGYQSAHRDRFEVAKERARQVADESVQGDGFSLILMADTPRTIIGDVAFDPDDVGQEIDELQRTHGSASLIATLNEVEHILRTAATRHPRLIHHQVCFFTDLGRTTWGAVTAGDVRQRLVALAEKAGVVLIDVGESAGNNVAITRLSSDRSLPLRNDRVTLEVELQNFGTQEARRRLNLSVDGRSAVERSVTIPAGGTISSAFVVPFDLPGEHIVEASMEQDPLDIDNRRWLSLPVREQVRVLCVQGKPDAAKYLALALSPEDDIGSRIRPEVAAENALLERELDEYDCVWLCNVGRIDREEIEHLHRYVQRGGGLIVSLGDQVQPDNYNRELGGDASGLRVLPARLGRVERDTLQRFDPLDYRHSVLDPFRGHERAGLLTVPTWRYFQLIPSHPGKIQTVLAFRSGDPAIVEEAIGRGRSVLLATSVSLASVDRSVSPPVTWTGLATWPCFPPLMHHLLYYAVRGRAPRRNALVGEPLASHLQGVGAETVVAVLAPDGRTERVPIRVEGTDRHWRYGPAKLSGVYEVDCGSPSQPKEQFAVNVDTRESDLDRIDRKWLPPQIEDQVIYHAGAAVFAGADNGWPLYRVVLSVLLLALIVETLLAYRFGGAGGDGVTG